MGSKKRAKTSKRSFIIKMSNKCGLTVAEAYDVYDAFMKTLVDEILSGKDVIFTGFGTFTLKPHKGHKIRFSDKESINDYLTLKFAVSNAFNKQIKNIDDTLKAKIANSNAVENKTCTKE